MAIKRQKYTANHLILTMFLTCISSSLAFLSPIPTRSFSKTSKTPNEKKYVAQEKLIFGRDSSIISLPPLALKNRRQSRDEFDDEDDDDDEDDYNERKEYEYARIGRRGKRYRVDYDNEGREYERDNDRYNEDFYYDDGDAGDFAMGVDDDETQYGWGETIPNPILDSIDPERTTDRVGELFADKRFWRDMTVVVGALAIWQLTIPTPWLSQIKNFT